MFTRKSHSPGMQIGILSWAGLLLFCLAPLAIAGPIDISGNTATATGDQSGGIISGVNFNTPPITVLNINNITGNIAPSSGAGVYFYNAAGSSVAINSGTSESNFTIRTQGNSATGIMAISEGAPAGINWLAGLGILAPAGAAGSGGPVEVTSYSDINTTGNDSYGIYASNRIGVYNPFTLISVSNFSMADVNTTLASVAGQAGNIGTQVAGDNGGLFTLNANGTYDFNSTGMAAGLDVNESVVTKVNYQVQIAHTPGSLFPFIWVYGSQTSNGSVAVRVTKNGDGSLTIVPEVYFANFSSYSYDVNGVHPNLWPNLQNYVNGLSADMGIGGAGDSIVVTNNGSIVTSGTSSYGIYATTTGGTGYHGRDGSFWDSDRIPTQGGTGSNGGAISVVNDGNVTTKGNFAAGILTTSTGGTGGHGGDGSDWRYGKPGGTGGTGGQINITGGGKINTAGLYASGILAVSQGGVGGVGGEGAGTTGGGSGGFGGTGGIVNVAGDWDITTTGSLSHAIWGKSVGGAAGVGGSGGWLFGDPGTGGTGADGGKVSIVSDGELKTSGIFSFGIYAESVGGFGGSGGLTFAAFWSFGGDGGSAGSGGEVNVINLSNGSIETTGIAAHGIFAQSIGGGGGSGGGEFGLFVSLGGEGGAGGNGGKVDVSNFGDIHTSGIFSRGIYAHSIGGGGGDGGWAGGIVGIGGDGSYASNGGNVGVYNYGNILTTGIFSDAIFAESIGGGGGSGAGSGGFVSIGGTGAGGGNAGNITIENSGDINTTGWASRGIVAQSIGGGGGDGAGSGGWVSLGGDGGTSGTAGTIDILNSGLIHTSMAGSIGILAQSIGGGGGSGAGSGGWFTSIGGDGGASGDGNTVTIINSGVIATDGNSSQGIYAESVGGGGGSSGGSGALFASLGGDGGAAGNGGAVKVTSRGWIETAGDDSIALFAHSVGGGGGSGAGSGAWYCSIGGDGGASGNGGNVDVNNTAIIITDGNNSHGIFAQSVGGGGGKGEGSGALFFSMGGDGGAAGRGGDVSVVNDGNIAVLGVNSNGIFAQSVGGGGGTGGGSGALYVTLGGKGDAGGTAGDFNNGGSVFVRNSGIITTTDNNSHAIVAQSIGGGGGSANTAGAFLFSLGGEGGGGGNGGTVRVENSNQVETFGDLSSGIIAQSIGGGGGNGADVFNIAAMANISFSVGIGGNGGAGGDGNNVTVVNDGNIIIHGKSGNGILAQSIGGGGGNGGSSFVLSLAANVVEQIPIAINAAVSVGGDGGVGGNGGTVNIENSGVIATNGFLSAAVTGQSIGGGGGNGGNATSVSLTYNCDASGNVAIGGDGGAGGNGGTVNIENENIISTKGDFSYGVMGQSIGGGGGTGGDSTTISGDLSVAQEGKDLISPSLTVVVSIGGDGGAAGTGGTVNINNENLIDTDGAFSTGILAQSIGGGGGAGGSSSSYNVELSNVNGPLSEALGILNFSSTTRLGGDGGAGGNAGTVHVSNSGSIFTSGAFASGIAVQSIGGGGGMGGNTLKFEFSLDDVTQPSLPYLEEIGGLTSFEMNSVGSGGAAGNGGEVNVINTGTILTHGAFAHGIFAQSVGGGGGMAGISEELGITDLGDLIFGDNNEGTSNDINGSGIYFAGSLGGNGMGGKVFVNQTGNIITYGSGADGIFAQSAGGQQAGSEVSITVDGNIITDGNDSFGIFAQSIGKTGGGNISVNIQNGIVQGGDRSGAGVYIDGGANNVLNNSGTIFALSGMAIKGGDGNDTVQNYGNVTGSVNLGTGNNAFNNNSGAVFNAGPVVSLGAGHLLTNVGTLSPGGTGTVLTTAVTGNVTQTSSGNFLVDLDLDAEQADGLNVSGTSNLAGSTTINILNPGLVKPGTMQTTILSSAGGVTDSGLALDYQQSAVMNYELIRPNETDVDLRASVDFCPDKLNHNQRVIGDAVNRIQLKGSSAKFAPFAAELVNLPDVKSLGDAYDQLSPETYDALTTTTFDITQQYTQTLAKRMHSLRSYLDATGGTPAARQTLQNSAWVEGFGQVADQDADDGFTGFKYSLGGVSAGLDNLVSDGLLAGVSFGQAHTTINFNSDRGNGDIQSTFVSLYGSLFDDRAYLDMALSYGRQSYKNNRQVDVGGLANTAHSSHHGDLFSMYTEGGYNIAMQKWLLQPFASLQYIYLAEESFRESGASGVNLIVDDRKTESLVSNMGLRFIRPFDLTYWKGIPDVTVAWRHDYDIDNRLITAAFDGAPGVSFTTVNRDIDKDGVLVGGGITFLNKSAMSVYFRYDAEMRGDYDAQQMSGGFRYEF